MKLSQILYSQGFGARRECEGLIVSGLVTVEGKICDDPFQDFAPTDLHFTVRGESSSVSRVPGAAPRTSTPATAPCGVSTTVQPVGRRVSVKWPTERPATSQIDPAIRRRSGEHARRVLQTSADLTE